MIHMKTKLTRKIYQYVAVFEPDKRSGGFTVTIPALPGCISEGDSFEQAMENIKEAAALYLGETGGARKFQEEKDVVIAPIQVMI